MKSFQAKMQLGKNGLTSGFMETLRKTFKNHENVKISLLRSADGRADMEKIGAEICNQLGKNFTYKVIGFTIFIKKWRKLMKKQKNNINKE